MPISFRFRNGTTTRVPGTTGFASSPSMRYENVVNSGTGSATSASTSAAAAVSRVASLPNAESGAFRHGNRAAIDGRPVERVIREQSRAVQVGEVEQRREVRGRRDAEARLDHAAGHHGQVVRA